MVSPGSLGLAKQIIRNAAEFGFDEAGGRLLGGFWPPIKKALEPVMDELDRRFPMLTLATPSDAAIAANAATETLEKDKQLQEMLAANLDKFAQQQEGMVALLLRYDERFASINSAVDRGTQQLDRKLDAVIDAVRQLHFENKAAVPGWDPAAAMTIDELHQEVYECNHTAIEQANAGDRTAADRRLARGRALAEAGLQRVPGDLGLVVALGFIEKTQAAIDSSLHPDRASAAVSRAMECFAKGLRAGTGEVYVSALNGMANIYRLLKDYDRAIECGEILFQTAPSYSQAIVDYALALEDKLAKIGPERQLLQKLSFVYQHLLTVMVDPQQRTFSSTYIYVQKRAEEVGKLLKAGGGPAS